MDRQHDRKLAELARLRGAVLADARLADWLLETNRSPVFAERAAQAACERGIALDATQIDDLLEEAGRASPVLQVVPPPGWLPAAVVRRSGEAEVSWTYFGAHRLSEPYYRRSLAILASRPLNRLFRFSTPLPTVPPADALAPAGLIFHMSRCGSTLVTQLLAASDANVVVAEAPAIDQVVRADDPGLDDDTRAAELRALVGAFGQVRSGRERRLFVKLDSWHARALPLFRRAFPATPWLFLHRDPVEVLVSLLRDPSMQTTPQMVPPAFLGIDWRGEAPDADYAARALAAICEAIVAGLDRAGLVVNYDELPTALWTRILPHFQVQPTPDEILAMQTAASRYAKQPSRAFQPDSAEKQAAASEAVRSAVRRRLADVTARLAAAR